MTRFLVFVGALLASGAALVAAAQQAAAPNAERDFLSRIRRLTVEGRRAGEGYWSPDGKRLVFQSEREPGNPFYQIYVLDLATGDAEAHLAWHRQDDLRVLPSRQRRDPLRLDARRSQVEAVAGRGARVPRVRQGAPLLVGLRPGDGHLRATARRPARLKRLTTARGYDAEASYSPDGQWIVFSSMRDAYDRHARRDDEQKKLEDEPELLRRDLHHARRRLRAEAPDQRARLRRRPVLHATTARASSGAGSTSRG